MVVFETSVAADSGGYAEALAVAEQHAPGRRAFAVEGTGSYGAGLTRFLTGSGEQVFEVGRLRRERRSGGKTDALDAVRAARSVLAQERPATPRSRRRTRGAAGADGRSGGSGERETGRPLPAPRSAGHDTRAAAQPSCGRSPGHGCSRASPRRGPSADSDPELRGSLLALRSVARRVQQLTAEERELAREIKTLTAEARTAAARPARRRAAPRRPGRALLVTQRPDQKRGRVRPPRRRRPDPRLLRPDDPLPPRPQRRPHNSTAHSTDPRHPHAASTRPRSPTSNAASAKAKPAAKPTAASSATSPAASTDSSRTEHHRPA